MSTQSPSNQAWAEMMVLSLIWGGSFFSIAIALREIDVFTVVLHRVGWATLILWAVVWLRGLTVPLDRDTLIGFLGMGLLNNVIPFSLLSWGQTHIESGLTAILNASTAVFGVLVAALLFRAERLTANRALGSVLGFVGVVWIIGPDALQQFDLRELAQLAVIGSSLSYAFASCWARVRLKGMPPEVAAAGMLTAATLVLFPITVVVDGPPRLDLSIPTWGAIAYYAGAATAGAYLLYYRVLDMAGPANLLLITLIIPVVAVLLGWAFLDEVFQTRWITGFGIIGAGLLVIDGRLPGLLRKKVLG